MSDDDHETKPSRDRNGSSGGAARGRGVAGAGPAGHPHRGFERPVGPFRDIGGPGSVAATRQAVSEFGDHGFAVDVIFADHQNKPDVELFIARQWCDTGDVDMLLDLPNSSVALSVNAVARDKNPLVTSAAATTDLTGAQCSPHTVQWTFDTYMLSKAEGDGHRQGWG